MEKEKKIEPEMTHEQQLVSAIWHVVEALEGIESELEEIREVIKYK